MRIFTCSHSFISLIRNLNNILAKRTVYKLLIFCLLFFISNSVLLAQQRNSIYKIEDIKAFLFYNKDDAFLNNNVAGTFSANIIGSQVFDLFNVVIGEGDAKGYSDETLVIVKVSGIPSDSYEPRFIEFEAIKDGKKILSRKDEFWLGNSNKRFTAYMLYDTGCTDIKITARIIKDGKVESQLNKNIPFLCGE